VTMLDAHTTSLYPTLPIQVDQQSGYPLASKYTPHPQSTLSPSVTVATATSTTSIGVTDPEQPPSYESHTRTGRVAPAGYLNKRLS